ncbi:unnamed protein product [Penicillium egyptiacum]|uniref:trans-L-3-hydroxyproline dehydratase n=1 Tax=Penicillium egyptiacum TaxID=1303716 RepID=A0A9W4P5N3_9EURO|nr:unnamed protein product [Penicillium egyptiacum]
MVVDHEISFKPDGVDGAETGLCFFAEDQIDWSPTGSCVAARMALAHAKGTRQQVQTWAYNSLVSNHFNTGAFVASIVEEDVKIEGPNTKTDRSGVVVLVEGNA